MPELELCLVPHFLGFLPPLTKNAVSHSDQWFETTTKAIVSSFTSAFKIRVLNLAALN
jgi:hypothetical protein